MIRLAGFALLLGCAACSGSEAPPGNGSADANAAAPAPAPAPVANVAAAAPETVPSSEATPLNAAQLAAYPEARGLPADVQHFVVRRQDCEHWLGEEAYDAARGREIQGAVNASCSGADAEAARLRKRHKGDAKVNKTLDAFDTIGM
jgi:hypothetical protein